MNVLIADDEQIVLEGLQHIINWNELGFSICGTAEDGEETLQKILRLKPDLVLLDIRMPKMNGIEVIQHAAEQGYAGRFILLSGVSDFKYAQAAMRYSVDFYLTKPIDEDELSKAVHTIFQKLTVENKSHSSYERYKTRARQEILKEIFLNKCDYYSLDTEDLSLRTNTFQVVCYENYNSTFYSAVLDFYTLLNLPHNRHNDFEVMEWEQKKFVLLKSGMAINHFAHFVEEIANTSSLHFLDAVFLTYGRQVSSLEDIHLSYEDVLKANEIRFFCNEKQHVLSYNGNIVQEEKTRTLRKDMPAEYAEKIANYVQSKNQTLIAVTMKDLQEMLSFVNADIKDIKHFLIDIYILVKQKIMQVCRDESISFLANTAVFGLIERKYYLYEIIAFLAEQFEFWTRSIGCISGETVLEEILYYIQQNYHENLKLETIAPLFGYNSAYLGKMFRKKTGMSFNSYLDTVRINQSKKLLEENQLKVYEIATQIGYKNVDYFHKKFKKLAGTSPAEYRKNFS